MLTIELIARKHSNCEILACAEDTEIYVFDDKKVCIHAYSWYGEDDIHGEYKRSTNGVGEHKDDIVFAYMDNHETIRTLGTYLQEYASRLLKEQRYLLNEAEWVLAEMKSKLA